MPRFGYTSADMAGISAISRKPEMSDLSTVAAPDLDKSDIFVYVRFITIYYDLVRNVRFVGCVHVSHIV